MLKGTDVLDAALGCVAGQGYFFHRPMTGDACSPLLEDLVSDASRLTKRQDEAAPSKRQLAAISF